MDEMRVLMKTRYGFSSSGTVNKVAKKKKTKIIPVQIDFPLPTTIEGAQNRLNDPNTFLLPGEAYFKHEPKNIIGNLLRLEYVLDHHQDFIDKTITVGGWARQARLQQKNTVLFVKLSDGSNASALQIVITNKLPNWEQLSKVKVGYSLKIKGKIVKSPGKGQTIQMLVSGVQGQFVKIFGICEDTEDNKYPLRGKDINFETLRDLAHLRPRTQIMGAMNRVKNNLAFATHLFFQNNGFQYIHTPLITAADCQGAGQLFQVTTILPENGDVSKIPAKDGKIDYTQEFFAKKAALTVSGQLAVENTCCSLGNVYTFGPTFRAQVSHTKRHLAQFWMIQPELAFSDVFDTMQCAQAYIQYTIKFILMHNRNDLQYLATKKKDLIQYLQKLVQAPFARASYSQAIDILQKVQKKGVIFEQDVHWGMDLGSEHQRYLCEHVFNRPVILYNYPKDIKAFYMRDNSDGKTVASFDILAPQVGQIVGGSQRQQRLDVLTGKMQAKNMNVKDYWWYLDLRKFGTIPHAGFGLGFERLVMMCTGIDNIRQIITFPRTVNNCQF